MLNHAAYYIIKATDMNIGFDLDGVFIDKPPIIPKAIIEWLYKKHNHNLSYRIPKKWEQLVRKASHITILRPCIKTNRRYLKKMWDLNTHSYYLISGRFGFLEKETDKILSKHKINSYFSEKHINLQNEQPHVFKDRIIKKLKIDIYIDDDLDLLLYLAGINKNIDFYWIGRPKYAENIKLPTNVHQMENLKDFFDLHISKTFTS
jgi:hypothetical protein